MPHPGGKKRSKGSSRRAVGIEFGLVKPKRCDRELVKPKRSDCEAMRRRDDLRQRTARRAPAWWVANRDSGLRSAQEMPLLD